MTFQDLIYYALCGILYLTGLVFGLDYETISVYVCIYFWPALITAMPAVITLIAFYNWCKKLTLWNSILSPKPDSTVAPGFSTMTSSASSTSRKRSAEAELFCRVL